MSKWSLFNRLGVLMDARRGYSAGTENLMVDHDHLVRLDQPGTLRFICKHHGLRGMVGEVTVGA